MLPKIDFRSVGLKIMRSLQGTDSPPLIFPSGARTAVV